MISFTMTELELVVSVSCTLPFSDVVFPVQNVKNISDDK